MNEFHLRYFEKLEITCDDVGALASEYLDSELAPSLHLRVKDHLDSCPECQATMAELEMLLALAKDLSAKPLPEKVAQRLRHSLNERLGLSLPIADSKDEQSLEDYTLSVDEFEDED